MRDPEQEPGLASDARGGGPSLDDAELIAAFIDRQLSPEERRRFLERLDREEALYEVFVETVRYCEEGTGEGAEVVEHPAGRRRWGRLGAIAALLAAAIGTPFVLRNLPPASYAGALVAGGRLDAVLDEGWYEQEWSVTRGVGAAGGEADAAFRLGVRMVDLEIALRAGRVEDAGILTHRIEALLDRVELSQPLQLTFASLRQRLEAGEPSAAALELAESAEPFVRDHFPAAGHAYELGRWAEAGKLAALSGNRKLLGSRRFRRSLGELRRESWEPETARRLAALAELLEPPAAQLDLLRLEATFTALIAQG